jgi:hypothetical protein
VLDGSVSLQQAFNEARPPQPTRQERQERTNSPIDEQKMPSPGTRHTGQRWRSRGSVAPDPREPRLLAPVQQAVAGPGFLASCYDVVRISRSPSGRAVCFPLHLHCNGSGCPADKAHHGGDDKWRHQPSSARLPASVINRRSILPCPDLTVSVNTVASPANTSIPSISEESPWPSTSMSAAVPRGLLASNWSARCHSGLRRCLGGNRDRKALIGYPSEETPHRR